MFSAKLEVEADGLNVAPEIVGCQLSVQGGGGFYDYAYGTVSSDGSGNVLVSTLAMQLTYSLPGSGGTASVNCDAPQSPAKAYYIKLTAVQVGGLS